ncbi:hypothetical protein D3C80_1639570 [compost metagenome]
MLISDLFKARHFQTLAVLDGLHVLRGFQQAIVSTGIEPGKAAAEAFDTQVAALQVGVVDVCDFKLATCRRLYILGDLDHVVVVEIKARDRIAGFGLGGFFFDRKRATLVVEVNHAEPLRVFHPVTKHRGALRLLGCAQ